jgi:type II secretory pathway predicted ATPase ExeA
MKTGRPATSAHSTAPYRLHGTLRRHAIPQSDLRAALRFEAGKRRGETVASSTLSTLLVRRVWPSTITAEAIQRQVADFLRARGVPEAEIADCWTPEGDVPDAGPPLGRELLAVGRREKSAAAEPTEPPFDLPEPDMLSPAAKEHFKLFRHPFIDDVQGPSDVFLSAEQRYIRESMYYAAKHSGLIAVVGESGSGKSTLRRDLIERVKRDNDLITVVQVKNIDKTTVSAAHICDAIIRDVGSEKPKLSLEAKADQVERILAGSARAGNAHVLIIEEAHDLTTPALKYLKRFWELEDGFRRLIGIVLIGQPELLLRLDERRNPDLRELIRRLEVATLKPLNGNLEQYLALKFKRVGKDLDEVFEKDAFDAIRARLTRRRQNSADIESHLYPLVVHNLVIKSMNLAVEIGLPKIGAELVGRV